MIARRVDVAIVGAGSAGSVLAARLSEDPSRSVVLIEAGPDYPDFDALPAELKFGVGTGTDITTESHNWSFEGSVTAESDTVLVTGGRVTGGTSAINGQVFRRGLRDDFDSWAAAGNAGWSFNDVLPYFRKSERDLDFDGDFHGDAGPVPVVRPRRELWPSMHQAFFEGCRELGFPEDLDQNAPDATGVGARPFNNVNGIRMSTALCYLAPARGRSNLEIRPGSTALRVRLEHGHARSVELSREGGVVEHIDADEVILAAGAIGSPHLLMLSGIGPARDLEKVGIEVFANVPGVGLGLRDHPMASLEYPASDGSLHPDWMPRMPVDLRCTSSGSLWRNDLQVIPRLVAAAPAAVGSPLGVARIRLTAAIQLELGAGHVRLKSDRPDVQPAIDYAVLGDGEDRIRLRNAVRLCESIARSVAFRPAIASALPLGDAGRALGADHLLDAWLRRHVSVEQHATSTCRMGPDTDADAVVDHLGAVRGVSGLRVIDASIMPNCVRANTNATVIMMAERIADKIAQAG